jgi:hypothetical protein
MSKKGHEMNELKKCPFCGEAVTHGDQKNYVIHFPGQHIHHGSMIMHNDVWNTRPLESALEAQRDQLLEACKMALDILENLPLPAESGSDQLRAAIAAAEPQEGGDA